MRVFRAAACAWASIILLFLVPAACGKKEPPDTTSEIPDLNNQVRNYITTESTRVHTGPGPEFRAIGEIRENSKVQVVGKDGEWLLIVSKKGNAPGYIDIGSVKPATSDETEPAAPVVEGKFETTVDTQVRSGPGSRYPVVADLKKGIKINVVSEESGWLKVESKRGNPPGYVKASMARPVDDSESR